MSIKDKRFSCATLVFETLKLFEVSISYLLFVSSWYIQKKGRNFLDECLIAFDYTTTTIIHIFKIMLGSHLQNGVVTFFRYIALFNKGTTARFFLVLEPIPFDHVED